MNADSKEFSAVWAAATALLDERVLQANNVSAGRGKVILWSDVKCGDEVLSDGDPFETAQMFVAFAGADAVLRVLETSDEDEADLELRTA